MQTSHRILYLQARMWVRYVKVIKFYVNALRQAKSSTLRMFTTPAWKPLIASPWQLWWTSNSCAFTGGWVRRSTLWMTLEGWVEIFYPVNIISQKSPLFIYSERRIQVARQKNPNQTNGTNRFYFLPRCSTHQWLPKIRQVQRNRWRETFTKEWINKKQLFINYPLS